MRVVCISDTHCQLGDFHIPDGDILVHAGDLTFRGDLKEVAEELAKLAALPHKHKILVAGNHDWLFQKQPEMARTLCLERGITYLEDSRAEACGLKFWGSPWQPEFGNWAFNLPRYEGGLAEKWSNIPDDTDFLITHGPPFGTLDMTKSYSGMPRDNVGCQDLRDRLKVLRPKYHVFGHIHPSYGTERKDGTLYINASVCNEAYDPVNAPIQINI